MSRRLRAALVVAGLWSVGWTVYGFLYSVAYWYRGPAWVQQRNSFISWTLHSMLPFAIAGAVCGLAFALLLGRAERNRTVGDLPIARTALWGAVAAFTSAVLIGAMVQAMRGQAPPLSLFAEAGWFAVVGAISAGGSLAAARRGRIAAAVEVERIGPGEGIRP